jgi:hypothetical protein
MQLFQIFQKTNPNNMSLSNLFTTAQVTKFVYTNNNNIANVAIIDE